MLTQKESNPKDALGIMKSPLSTLPTTVLHEVGIAMLEGALKYGCHNYRVIGVRARVYYDALMRHMNAWWEGEDIDEESGLSHVTKAISCLMILRDAMIRGKMVDDRPPSTPGFMKEMNALTANLMKKHPNPKTPYCQDPSLYLQDA